MFSRLQSKQFSFTSNSYKVPFVEGVREWNNDQDILNITKVNIEFTHDVTEFRMFLGGYVPTKTLKLPNSNKLHILELREYLGWLPFLESVHIPNLEPNALTTEHKSKLARLLSRDVKLYLKTDTEKQAIKLLSIFLLENDTPLDYVQKISSLNSLDWKVIKDAVHRYENNKTVARHTVIQ